MNWKEFKVMLFGNLPFIGNRIRHNHYHMLMERIAFIERQFTKPMVLFDDNMHDLYDCLKGTVIALEEEDFDWFRDVGITNFTITSRNASELVIRVLNNEVFKYEKYFKQLSAYSLETDFLDWYSNLNSVKDFIENFLFLLDVYCKENPRGDEVFTTSKTMVNTPKGALEFFNSSYFKLLLADFITIVMLSLDSQLRRLNGYQK